MKPSEIALVVAVLAIPAIVIGLLLTPGVVSPFIAYASTRTGSWVVFGGLAAAVFGVLVWRLYRRITGRR
jgi:hypothetical protein